MDETVEVKPTYSRFKGDTYVKTFERELLRVRPGLLKKGDLRNRNNKIYTHVKIREHKITILSGK